MSLCVWCLCYKYDTIPYAIQWYDRINIPFRLCLLSWKLKYRKSCCEEQLLCASIQVCGETSVWWTWWSLCAGLVEPLTYARRSQWSIGHQRPPAIALCSGLLLSFRTSWSPAVSAMLQCLASNCCEAGLSSSSPAGSRSGLGVWYWMLASWGCVWSSPTSSAVSAWPLVTVPLAPTDLHFGSSLAIGFCRCASDRCWRMSGSLVASSVLSAMSQNRTAGLTSHWSWRCGVWFSCWFLQVPRCFWAWQKLLLPCRFWLWHLGLCLPDGQPHFPGRRKTPPPLRALHQLWLVRWQLCSSSSAQSSFCWPCPCWCGLQESGLVLHLAVIVWQECQVISEVEVV